MHLNNTVIVKDFYNCCLLLQGDNSDMEMFQDQQLPFSNINIQYKINLFKFKHILFANITNGIKHKSYKLMMSFYYNIFYIQYIP